MSSMIVSTKPDRRILEASSELAEAVGSEPKRMCGFDCAKTVQCRNAEGKLLCGQFCPALAAARSRLGVVQGVPVWLRNSDGELEEYATTFQRVGNLPNGMVVAFFGDPEEEEEEVFPAPAAGDWVPQLERRPRQMRAHHPQERRSQRRQRARLRLLSG